MTVRVNSWHDAIESARVRGEFSASVRDAACDPRKSPDAELRVMYDLPCKRGFFGEPVPVVNGYIFPVGAFAVAVCEDNFDRVEAILTEMERQTEAWVNAK